ncbi:TetR/AcrR family transcriptional regulator [Sorangium sp. So ce542]|uniref:TetR/AcrR family transcriptional regulator n=1 Tax=Sorangium sp. So ce542 TaxID=3133316 RepID=UPI003F5EF8E6
MNKSTKKSGNEGRDRGGDRTRSAGKIADRRVQKTRKLLSDALVSLILEKGYDQVSIQDIIDRANVGRSTFYAHYENKEQLLLFGHEHLRALALRDAGRPLDFLPFYRHIAEMHELVRKLLSAEKSERVVTRSLEDILQGSICRLYAPRTAPEEGALFMLRSEVAAAALVRLMTSWVQKGMPCSPERMAEESTALLQRILADERAAASGRTRKE